ncbi:MAG: hypothetical protein STHCBS139747_000007 [Sporothrix thermara]
MSIYGEPGPPATRPPATRPPATRPPATRPPATRPPATRPPATKPPAWTLRDSFHYGDTLAPDQPLHRKLEAHRQRKSLKDSGDYLGVQGVNPETGQLDVLTPTTGSKSTLSSSTATVMGGGSAVQRNRERYDREKDKDKDGLRRQQSLIRWRKDTGQWSSVANEPWLSPIAQSQDPTPHSEKKHAVVSAAACEPEPFLPLPSLHSPDPRGDMHWGLASTRLADDHDSESGDTLQASTHHAHGAAAAAAAAQPSATAEDTAEDAAEHWSSRVGSTDSSLRAEGDVTKDSKYGQHSSNTKKAYFESKGDDAGKGDGYVGRAGSEAVGTIGDAGRSQQARVCLHIHHHHYWIRYPSPRGRHQPKHASGQDVPRVDVAYGPDEMSDMHDAFRGSYRSRSGLGGPDTDGTNGSPNGSPNGSQSRIQAALSQREAALFVDSFPPERETERLAELDRPPSRDSHARYYIVEAPHGDKTAH